MSDSKVKRSRAFVILDYPDINLVPEASVGDPARHVNVDLTGFNYLCYSALCVLLLKYSDTSIWGQLRESAA